MTFMRSRHRVSVDRWCSSVAVADAPIVSSDDDCPLSALAYVRTRLQSRNTGVFWSIIVYKRYRLLLKIRAMIRFALVLIVASVGLASVAAASPEQGRKSAGKSAHRRHRGDSAENSAKDEPPKSEQAQLAEKIANCKGDDPLCGTGM